MCHFVTNVPSIKNNNFKVMKTQTFQSNSRFYLGSQGHGRTFHFHDMMFICLRLSFSICSWSLSAVRRAFLWYASVRLILSCLISAIKFCFSSVHKTSSQTQMKMQINNTTLFSSFYIILNLEFSFFWCLFGDHH